MPSQIFYKFLFFIQTSSMNIFVSNLSFNVQDEDLREFFTPYGEVTSAKIINDKETGRSRGFGFVEMSDDEAAKKAIAELDQATVEGRAIKVTEAKPREDRPARSFSGGGGGGGYNNRNNNNRW
jgi:RNA recognition motif-containing protein